jgi:hypothetical protein
MQTLRTIARKSPRAYYLNQVLRQGFKAKYPAGDSLNHIKQRSLFDAAFTSFVDSVKHADAFKSVQSYCMFLGHPRSGHSIIGALMDAHPEMLISHELNALKYFTVGFRRGQVFSLILDNSQRQAAAGRGESGYKYIVANQWQGKFRTLRVIGDKDARRDSSMLRRYPQLLDTVRARVGVPVKLVHMIRNPFDNIATNARRAGVESADDPRFLPFLERYFAECETAAAIRASLGERMVLDVRHEDFIADPRRELTRICEFFEIDAPRDYLDDCASIVFTSPNKSRLKYRWEQSVRDRIDAGVTRFDFLSDYTFDS